MHKASVIHFIIKSFPVNQILYYPNTKQSSSFMAVSGMDIKIANTLSYQKPELIGG